MRRALLRVQLRALLCQLSGGRRKGLYPLLPGLVSLLFLVLFYGLFQALRLLSSPEDYFASFAAISLLMGTLATAFPARSTLFEARDNGLLLSLPIPWRVILGSRMAVLLGMNLLSQLLIALPAACCAAFPGIGAMLLFALLCLMLTLCATALASLLGWLLALLLRRVRHRSLASVLAVLLFLGIYGFVCFRMAAGEEAALSGGLSHLLAELGSLPPLCWMGRMALGSAGELPRCAACLLLPFLLAMTLLSRSFQKTTAPADTVPAAAGRAVVTPPRNPHAALLQKELRRFLSSPTYVINGGMGLLLLAAAGVLLPMQRQRLETALPPELKTLLLPLLLSGGAILLSMTLITAPSVSLEGRSLWLGRSLPVEPWLLLRGKLALQCTLTLPPLLLYWLCMLPVARPHPLIAGLGLLYLLAMALLTALLGLYWGLRRARFDWLNEAQVVKQGAAVGLSLLSGWLAVLLSSGVMLGLSWLLGPPMGIFCAAALAAGGCALLYRWLRRRGGGCYTSLPL